MPRHARLTLFAALVAVALLVRAPDPAQAHCPIQVDRRIGPDDPWVIDNLTAFTAFHAALTDADPVHYFVVEGHAGQLLSLELAVPYSSGRDAFLPALIVLGPGLPPMDLPAGIVQLVDGGALLFPPRFPPPVAVDEDTGAYYWLRVGQVMTLPADGTYVIVVWQPDGQTGAYVLGTGTQQVACGQAPAPGQG